MTPRKIAFVSDAIYPYNKGGKETRLFEITTRLAKNGHDVHIYCMQWWQGKSDRIEHGVHLHGICPYIPLYDGTRRSIKQGVLFGLSCFKLLFTSFDVVDVDHMPFFPLYSVRIVCWLKGKKMNATWHEVWGTEYWKTYVGSYKGVLAGLIESISVKLPDTICAVSDLTATRLQKQLGYSNKLVVIPNGIDLVEITATKKSTQTSDVIFAGRLLAHKNVDVLLEAIAELKQTLLNIQAIIVGEGPEKSALQTLAKTLKIEHNVTFLPFKDDIRELYSLIKASKVFVLPSTREGFGLVVLEANACGIPVITIDHPDNAAKELINGENGMIVKLSSSSIAQAVKSLLNAKALPKQTLEKYDWNSIILRFEEAY